MNPIIYHGDCLTTELPTVDSIVTDPPYGLSFMGKGWDHEVPGKEYWEHFLRFAKPGAHLVAFGGTRCWHRLAVAIEDAGWEIRDCLMWLYGVGFPKSHSLPGGWGTALKPAYEPIILARKPFKGTVADNVLQRGTGALNIDGCRVGVGEPVVGRWPANVVLDEGAGRVLDEQSGVSKSSGGLTVGVGAQDGRVYGFGDKLGANAGGLGDTGGASRFFYTAKASRAEREDGLESDGQRANTHPTVKPIDLMRWLVRMVTPPGGLVLDPFTGSGTTGCAAMLEGMEFVGCEIDPEHTSTASDRIRRARERAGRITADDLEDLPEGKAVQLGLL